MNQQNQDTMNSPPPTANDGLAKRKRGRPRKDENSTPKPDTNLVGKAVTGVVEGSFDAGYLLNVKVKDSDTKLRGLVFIPGKVNPITPENDVAPLVKMYEREDIKTNQADHSFPTDQPMKDADTTDQPMKDAAVTTVLDISESTRALVLVPQASNGQPKEAKMEKDGVTAQHADTRLVDFFPTPGTMMMTTAQPNFVLVPKETEQPKSLGETCGFDLMATEPVRQGEKVPEQLQLELGNKTTLSGDNNNYIATTEPDPKTSVSKRGLIANLLEGEEKKVDSNMEEEATPSVQ
ncbi:hypothetical protein ISN45_Aa07g019980 [Arabidopsis thaliana x Arabidopsis arenosa]|uniref:AT hook motif-containing protein n=1 Tax=Arabidopsis thaliana x Arabidopsis arenosa TaxID=1240361 RepID=A0A8T1Y4N8_9BRAS|nr:hypothetical protein ISN45_Aa07g019980 [Arabidopsis thaliana x Arabidopsis arenosa]